MIVCSCNVLSDGQVKGCLGPGPGCPRTAAQVYQCLGCSPKCGRCARTIRAIMKDALVEVHGACATSCSSSCPLSATPGDGISDITHTMHRHADHDTNVMVGAG